MNHRIEYTRRTLQHIHRVHFNMLYLIENLGKDFFTRKVLDTRALMHQVMHHDISKFNDVQFFAYADYFNGTQPPDDATRKEFEFAWENHKHNENHHFQGCRYMRHNQIIEMVCDWQAMSQEFGEGSCRNYYEKKWKPQYLEYYKNIGFSQGYSGNYCDDYEFALMCETIIECIKCFELNEE